MHSCFYLILLLFRTFFLYLFRGGVYSNVAPSLPYLHALKTKNERNFSLRMDISKTVPGFKPINIIRTCTRAQVYGSTVYGVWNKESNEYKFWGYFLSETSEDANQKCAKNYCFGGYYVLIFPSVKMNFSFSAVKFPIFEKQNISL